MEERNDSSLELRSSAGIDGRGRESLPDYGFANVGSDEQRDTTAQPISLLKKLIQKNDNKTSHNQLDDQEHTDTSAKIGWLSVKTSENIDTSLAEGENDCKKLLSGLVEFAVCFQVQVDIN